MAFARVLSGACCALLALPSAATDGDVQQQPQHGQQNVAHDAVFRRFINEHGRAYALDSEEYGRRFALFRERATEVEKQNANPSRRWTAALNHLADRTEDELAMLRGYRHGAARAGAGAGAGGLGLLAETSQEVDVSTLPTDFSWRTKLAAMQEIVNQGSCGSCWAVATTTVLRAHAELYQKDRTFSAQQLVDCTPNPQECGGQGGCQGATAELAMEYAAKQGLVTEEKRTYTAEEEECPADMRVLEHKSGASFLSMRASVRRGADGTVTVANGKGAAFGLLGWRKLDENRAEPLLEAIVHKGPVAVSVAASLWTLYSSGILDSCMRGAVVNHAVTLVGYGQEGKAKFWQIQNSWGPNWGEEGFIRIIRHDTKEENEFCGWDMSPEDGTACKGGPDKVWVCGGCGILYDSVVPEMALAETGWWHHTGKRPIPASMA